MQSTLREISFRVAGCCGSSIGNRLQAFAPKAELVDVVHTLKQVMCIKG